MSKQPRKQRNQTENASLHEMQNQVRATLSEDLREEYGRRNARVNEGDTVEIMRGDDAGEDEEVIAVDLKDAIVHVENVTIETADGEEMPKPLEPSNLRITDLDLSDDRREARLEGENE
ncbi:MAG: large subunit ribosomal protein L24 [Halobacteriales archaeon]|jgi:large subunit ribosomal protein L24